MNADNPLPTRAQLAVITDRCALEALKDDIDQVSARIEADLEFGDGDQGWRFRAQGALARHRHASRMVAGRLKALRPAQISAVPKPATRRPERDIHPLTREVLERLPEIDVAGIGDPGEIDRQFERLSLRIEALDADRVDEIATHGPNRDEGFLAATGVVLPKLRRLRFELQPRRGQITRAARDRDQAVRQPLREELFIDAAREMLPRTLYEQIWATVDRREAATP